MRTAEEIKRGLECCAYERVSNCPDCPYLEPECEGKVLEGDALSYIQQLEVELEQSENKLAELLSYVTGGRFSKVTYTIDEMKCLADDYLQSTSEY